MKIYAKLLRSDIVYFSAIIIAMGVSWALGLFSVEHLVGTRVAPPWNLVLIALPVLPLLFITPLVVLRWRLRATTKNVGMLIYAFPGVVVFAVYTIAVVVALFHQGLSFDRISFLAMVVTLPIGLTLAMVLDETRFDEFYGAVLTRAAMYSIALTLFFAALWGFLENFAEVPDFPLYLIVPVFFGLFGVAHYVVRRGFK